jgi:hypothetical protein
MKYTARLNKEQRTLEKSREYWHQPHFQENASLLHNIE